MVLPDMCRIGKENLVFLPPLRSLVLEDCRTNNKASGALHLPQTLRYLHLKTWDSFCFNQAILPSCLETLHLSGSIYWDGPWPENGLSFPLSLKTLRIEHGFNFNDSMVDHLPPKLTSLTIGDFFSAPLGFLPSSLVNLRLGDDFDSSLENLPSNLRSLHLGYNYSLPLPLLPSSLEELRFHSSSVYNLPFGTPPLPLSLKRLTLGHSFQQSLDSLPRGIEEIVFGGESDKQALNGAMDVVKYMLNGDKFTKLSRLSFYTCYALDLACLPLSIQEISMGAYFDEPVDVLKYYRQLRKLCFGRAFNHELEHLPECLKELLFPLESLFDQSIDLLPSGLQVLTLGDQFNQPVTRLPSDLKKLQIGDGFSHPLPFPDPLPNNLQSLVVGYKFYHHIDQFPSTLRVLILKGAYLKVFLPEEVLSLIGALPLLKRMGIPEGVHDQIKENAVVLAGIAARNIVLSAY